MFSDWSHVPSSPSSFLSHLPIFPSVVRVPLQHGQQLYRHIYLGCKEDDNVHKNFELLFTTLAVLTIELANEEVVIDLIRLAIALQVTPPPTLPTPLCHVTWWQVNLGKQDVNKTKREQEKLVRR